MKDDGKAFEEMDIEDEKDEFEEEKEEKGDWTPEQDYYLTMIVKSSEIYHWGNICDKFNMLLGSGTKTSKQCRERWFNTLDPMINHSPWSKQEEAILILSHMKLKNRWCDISMNLQGRNNNMVKNRFYSIFRKIKKKIQQNDLSCSSKLDLLEAYYITSVIEDYINNPLPPDEPKRKRGKDFMYTLVESIKVPQLEQYKLALHAKHKLKAPLEKLLEEIAKSQPVSKQTAKVQRPSLAPLLLVSTQNQCAPSHDAQLMSTGSSPSQPARTNLPFPKSFVVKDTLTPDEKEFVITNAFQPKKCEPLTTGLPYGRSYHPSYAQVGPYSTGQFGHSPENPVYYGGFNDISTNSFSQLQIALPGVPASVPKGVAIPTDQSSLDSHLNPFSSK